MHILCPMIKKQEAVEFVIQRAVTLVLNVVDLKVLNIDDYFRL